MALFSSVAKVAVRPFRTYEALARTLEAETPRAVGVRVAVGAVRLLLVVGAFVSFTSTGRLLPIDTLVAASAYSWLLGVQALALYCARRVARSERPYWTLAALYLEGHGVWHLSLLAVSGALLFARDALAGVAVVVPVAVVVAFVWGIVTTFALFSRAAGVPRRRAVFATFTFYVAMMGIVVSYYVFMGQLLPILPFARVPS